MTPQIVRLPSVSLSESIEIEKRAHQVLREFPEVRTAVSKIGRPDITINRRSRMRAIRS
ncbi:MAG: hypothetical protein U0361_10870 [Nitrospiraceae bacterium]